MKKNKRKNPLVIIILLLLLAGMGLLGYHLFNITAIDFTGNIEKKADYLRNLSGVAIGTNIFKIDDKTVKTNLEKDPYIKFIQVKKNYPDKIVIEIKERVPAALIQVEKSYLLLDEEGFILKILKDKNGVTYPLLSGIDSANSSVGKQISFADEAQKLALQTILSEIYKNKINTLIATIDILSINNIKMTTATGIAINFGDFEETEKKIQWIKGALAYCEKEGKKGGTLDVSTGEFASYKEPAQESAPK